MSIVINNIDTRIVLIVAVDQNYNIGANGQKPWDEELGASLIDRLTKDQIVVMGRKTYEGLPDPLGMIDRTTLVFSQKAAAADSDASRLVFTGTHTPRPGKKTTSIHDDKHYLVSGTNLSDMVGEHPTVEQKLAETKTVYILGGASLFGIFGNIADEFILLHIHAMFDGDTQFPCYFDNSIIDKRTMVEETDTYHAYRYTIPN